ncbi:MAG: hypothetical protein KatS3mg057_2969 [Herpetosiphonaceae bacterium]|nr:MAG: hypothetical protein KatS3mg057_2969 [Herpetosiphonaceae bacterium]
MSSTPTSPGTVSSDHDVLVPGQAALLRITQAIATAVGLEELLLLALRELTDLFHLSHGSVLLIDEEGQTGRVEGEYPPRTGTPCPSLSLAGDPLIAEMLASRQPIAISDVPSANLGEPIRKLFENRQPRALLLLPLFAHNRLIGILGLDGDDENRCFTIDELLLGRVLAIQLALAISTARIYEDARRRSAELATLNDIAATVTSSLDPRQIYKHIVQKLNEHFDVEAGSILLLDEESGDLYFVMTIEAGEESPVMSMRVPAGHGVAGYVAQTQQPLIVLDAQNDPRHYRKVGKDVGFVTKSILCVPMLVKGRTVGVVQLLNKVNGAFTEEDAQRLAAMANTVAVAIDNARLFQEVARGRDRLEALLNSTEDGILMIESSGQVVTANPMLGRFFGLPWRELIGRPGIEVMQEIERRTKLASPPRPAAQNGDSGETIDLEVLEPEHMFLRQVKLPVQSKEGTIIGQLVVFHDITEERQLEQLREDYTGMLVHDLRSPLTGVLNGLTMVRRGLAGEITDMQRELLDIAANSGQAMLGMINTLLDISKMESGQMKLEREPTSLYEIVDAAIERVIASARNAEIEVRNELPAGLPLVEIDREKSVRVLQNLLDNAIKFTPAKGTVRILGVVEQKDSGASVVISVQDTGPGIPEAYRRRIFEKFGQVEGRKVKGTGLGLAFCRLAVESHGGEIWVDSQEGQGSTFSFRLPLSA